MKLQKLSAAERDISVSGDAQWLEAGASTATGSGVKTAPIEYRVAAPAKVCENWYSFLFDGDCETVPVAFMLTGLIVALSTMYIIFDRCGLLASGELSTRAPAALIDPAARGETVGPGQTSQYERVNRFYQPSQHSSGGAAGVSMPWN